MEIGVCSDVGRIREVNQDSYYYSEDSKFPLYVVADGMGGHNAGEIASSMAIEAIKETFIQKKDALENNRIEIPLFINEVLVKANENVLNQAVRVEAYKGMGTTTTMLYLHENIAYIGHLGDSRAYLLSDDRIIQLTQDHSLVAELVRKGSISEEEAANHPQKNIITRALGTQKEVKIDILTRDVKKNDFILLCTDGLTNMVSEEKMKETILMSDSVQEACERLIDLANESGGLDNTTVMIISLE